MDSTRSTLTAFATHLAHPRMRVFGVAAVVLVIIAVLQVNKAQRNAPMCELLKQCKLQTEDVQRLQIAFGKAGLVDFRIDGQKMLVPQAMHARYLAAATDNGAIPSDLQRDDQSESVSTNPFLSRSQQKAIEQTRKKKQIRDMVVRLPFVAQAWYEMDKADSGNAFVAAKQSAVISIRTTPQTPLTDRHVETVKQMISGAVAGLQTEDIVVIDLDNGLSHQYRVDEFTGHQIEIQQIAFNQQRFYESRIRESLVDYPDVKIRVQVEVAEIESTHDKIAMAPPMVLPAATTRFTPAPVLPTAGANGIVSLEPESPPATAESIPSSIASSDVATGNIDLVGHESRSNKTELEKQIAVFIDVPQSLVYSLYGQPAADPRHSAKAHQAAIQRETQAKFEQCKQDILNRVAALLPPAHTSTAAHTVDVNLVPAPLKAIASPTWTGKIQSFLTNNWPSVAVLSIGIALLSMVTRRPTSPPVAESALRQNADHDVLSINSAQPSEPTDSPEVQLTQLIEEDPDAAAKIIETWIRDAA